MTDYSSVVARLLAKQTKRESDQDMYAWFKRFKQQTSSMSQSVERAMYGGRTSDNVAYAFASGYQSAIESLFGLNEPLIASLCVTEEQGNHPRAIQTTLTQSNDHYLLNGKKNFVSGGCEAGFMFVACRVGEFDDGRPKLKVVSIPADLPGITIQALPILPFIPEISHGAVTFENVVVKPDQILDGDGYKDYVKPFRTVEDLHVLAAILAFRLGEAIHSEWRLDSVQKHLSLATTLLALGNMKIDDPAMHLAYAACRESLKDLVTSTDAEFQANNPEGFDEWVRDRKLLKVAEKAHEIRTRKAWDALGFIGD